MFSERGWGHAGFKLLQLQRSPYSRDLRRGWRTSSNLARSIPDATAAGDIGVAFAASVERAQGTGARSGARVTGFDCCIKFNNQMIAIKRSPGHRLDGEALAEVSVGSALPDGSDCTVCPAAQACTTSVQRRWKPCVLIRLRPAHERR
jgi:hypothetical protein